MRKSEGLRLKWGHVDLGQRRLTVAQSKTGHPRYIPLSPYALERLMALPRDLTAPRATMWLQHGVDAHTVQRYLGHTRIETTMRYLHFVADYAEKAVRAAQDSERKQWEKLSQRGRQMGDTQEAQSRW